MPSFDEDAVRQDYNNSLKLRRYFGIPERETAPFVVIRLNMDFVHAVRPNEANTLPLALNRSNHQAIISCAKTWLGDRTIRRADVNFVDALGTCVSESVISHSADEVVEDLRRMLRSVAGRCPEAMPA